MFWQAVLGGLGVFLHWEAYVCILGYMLICCIPMIVTIIIFSVTELSEGRNTFIMWISMTFAIPVFQSLALLIVIPILSPIILGFSHDAAWAFPWEVAHGAMLELIMFLGVLLLARVMLAFVPILNRMLSLPTLVQSVLILGFLSKALPDFFPDTFHEAPHILPGFWLFVGFVIAGAVITWIGMFVVGAIGVFFESSSEGLGVMLMIPVAGLFGLAATFIYGAWLGEQIIR